MNGSEAGAHWIRPKELCTELPVIAFAGTFALFVFPSPDVPPYAHPKAPVGFFEL